MRHSRFLTLFLLTALSLVLCGLTEAGTKGGHPEQFPYPDNLAEYFDPKTGCAIQAFENGGFDVFFPGGLEPGSLNPAFCSNDVSAYLYDPTTMSNTTKKIVSTQTSHVGLEVGCSTYQVESSSMAGSADAKKAKVTVKISDASLQNAIFTPGSIRPQPVPSYESTLVNAGFRLKSGWWTATCNAKRSITH